MKMPPQGKGLVLDHKMWRKMSDYNDTDVLQAEVLNRKRLHYGKHCRSPPRIENCFHCLARGFSSAKGTATFSHGLIFL